MTDSAPLVTPGSTVVAAVTAIQQRVLVDQWLEWLHREVALQQLADSTVEAYSKTIRYWLDYLETVARTDRPTPATVQHYVMALIAASQSPMTTNAYLNTVKSFYRWCETGDRYPSIARSVKTLHTFTDGPLPALTHAQMVELIRQIPEDTLIHLRDRALITLLYATAFRTISVVRADVEDLDLDGGTIAHQPKGHLAKDAIAIIARSVAQLLDRYLTSRRQEIGIPLTGAQPLFIALDRRCVGRRITTKSVRAVVLQYMELSGHAVRRNGQLINPGVYSAHSIRRSAAVTTADASGLDVAQGLLGHASIETTKASYARVKLDRRLRENAEHLDPLTY